MTTGATTITATTRTTAATAETTTTTAATVHMTKCAGHPHTIKAYSEYNWKRIFAIIKRLGYTNDDNKAGFHVHISHSYFGDESQQNEALAKLVFLIYKFKKGEQIILKY